MRHLLIGACAGLIATAPMTGVMKIIHRRLPLWERRALPPRRITNSVTQKIGVRQHMDESEARLATLAAHYGFGAIAGALYAPLAAKRSESGAIKGMVFSILVWAVSYLGWLPASGILCERAPRRQAMMLAAHLVWGWVVGTLTEQFESRNDTNK